MTNEKGEYMKLLRDVRGVCGDRELDYLGANSIDRIEMNLLMTEIIWQNLYDMTRY